MRFFNTAGPVRLDDHYAIPPRDRVDVDELLRLIRAKQYFVLHAPRQTGKTSALIALRDLLNHGEAGDFRCVDVNVEVGQVARDDTARGIRAVLGSLADSALLLGDDYPAGVWLDVLADMGPENALKGLLTRWCLADPTPLVLLVDEIDSLVGDTLLTVLRQLRAGYPQRPRGFPQSVVLCGVRDIRDYRIRSSTGEVVAGGSPFNVAAKSLRMGDFTEAETRALMAQHTEETGQRFSAAARDAVWTQTQGQPWLVNALCAEACFDDKAGRRRGAGAVLASARRPGPGNGPAGSEVRNRGGQVFAGAAGRDGKAGPRAMSLHLTDEQLRRFDDEGYLFLPGVFAPAETGLLLREAHAIFAGERREVVRERDGRTARTAFAAHRYNEAYRRLGRHPRLVRPVERILGGEVYVHQFKINAKAAFDGDVWQWHQDYGVWSRDDGMPECRAMNVALFLEDVTEFNGALTFIPRSHRKGVLEAGHDVETTSYPLWTIDNATIARLVEEGGLAAPKGRAGSLVMFSGNLVHGSPSNMSPFDRTIVYLSLCRVDNHIQRFKRPEWIAHRDFTPIECLGDDCLTSLAAEGAPAAAETAETAAAA